MNGSDCSSRSESPTPSPEVAYLAKIVYDLSKGKTALKNLKKMSWEKLTEMHQELIYREKLTDSIEKSSKLSCSHYTTDRLRDMFENERKEKALAYLREYGDSVTEEDDYDYETFLSFVEKVRRKYRDKKPRGVEKRTRLLLEIKSLLKKEKERYEKFKNKMQPLALVSVRVLERYVEDIKRERLVFDLVENYEEDYLEELSLEQLETLKKTSDSQVSVRVELIECLKKTGLWSEKTLNGSSTTKLQGLHKKYLQTQYISTKAPQKAKDCLEDKEGNMLWDPQENLKITSNRTRFLKDMTDSLWFDLVEN